MDELKSLEEKYENYIRFLMHDIRNPLLSMKGCLDMLLEDKAQFEEFHRSLIENAHESAQRMERFISGVAEVTERTYGGKRLNLSRWNFTSLMGDLISEFSDLSRQQSTRVTLNAPPECWVHADRSAMEKALRHLIENAIRFTYEGEVSVTLCAGEAGVDVDIHDTGVGVNLDPPEKMFDRLKEKGRGLGAALAKKIIDSHGGEISVSSQKDKGTHLRLRLPLPSSQSNQKAA